MAAALYKGTWLGSAACYHMAYYRLPEIYDFILQNYGKPPQHGLRYDIEKFLNTQY